MDKKNLVLLVCLFVGLHAPKTASAENDCVFEQRDLKKYLEVLNDVWIDIPAKQPNYNNYYKEINVVLIDKICDSRDRKAIIFNRTKSGIPNRGVDIGSRLEFVENYGKHIHLSFESEKEYPITDEFRRTYFKTKTNHLWVQLYCSDTREIVKMLPIIPGFLDQVYFEEKIFMKEIE